VRRADIDVVAFDVNETLFSLDAIRRACEEHALPPGLVDLWFSRTLRDGFALTALGEYAPFPVVGAAALRAVAPRPLDEAEVSAIMGAMRALDAHPDVEPCLRLLRGSGLRLVTLTNGTAANTAHLLERNGLSGYVEQALSVDSVRRWKPAAEPYLHAARATGTAPERVALVAVHGWDTHGARRAGLRSGWVSRLEHERAPYYAAADLEAPTLDAWAARLLGPRVEVGASGAGG
jgi:2-haloacid dehalogenase